MDLFKDSFSHKSKRNVKMLIQSMENRKIDSFRLIEDCFSKFFFEYFPHDIVISLFFVYLNEGIKTLYRMGYAFFKLYKNEILNSKDLNQIQYAIKKRANNLTDFDRELIYLVRNLKIIYIDLCFNK